MTRLVEAALARPRACVALGAHRSLSALPGVSPRTSAGPFCHACSMRCGGRRSRWTGS